MHLQTNLIRLICDIYTRMREKKCIYILVRYTEE